MTEDAELRALFKETLETPSKWWWSGKNLLFAAELLLQRWGIDMEDCVARNDGGAITLSGRTTGPLFLLRACALESLLKAILVELGEIKEANGELYGRTHKLPELASKAGYGGDPELEDILVELESWYELGRFPVRTNAETSFTLTAWNPRTKREAVYRAFVQRLKDDHDERLSRQGE